jgi:hypothetical protein
MAIVDALVVTLKHESPFCVAAAAAVLGWAAQTPGVGKAKIAASAAIPALLNVIETRAPPGNIEQATGLFRRCVSEDASPASAIPGMCLYRAYYQPVCMALCNYVHN